MNYITKKLFLFIFLVCSLNVYSLDINITEKEVETYLGVGYSRGFYQYGEVSAIGAVELYDRYKLRGGILFEKTSVNYDINTFINAGCSPFLKLPLSFSLAYIYNGLPEYEAHTHSIMPIVSFNAKRAGISLAANFRLSSFFGEPAIFESILSLYAYFNFINTDKLNIGVGGGNFSDFSARNIGAYSLNLYAAIHIDGKWSIINKIELMQSGGDGLTTTFYKLAYRAGVKFLW